MMESTVAHPKSAGGVWGLIFKCIEFTSVSCVCGQAQYLHTQIKIHGRNISRPLLVSVNK